MDTQTSGTAVSYRNEQQPDAPVDVTLAATGNETLTAEWRAVAGADGYRVTLYYQENGSWKQAGASYVLDNADFDADSDIAAASRSGGRLALRMAPTAGGSGYWEVSAGDADAAALIESGGRVLLAVRSGPSGMDTTEYYLRLMLDDVPPVITLDAVNVRADMTTGAYTVSGRTEPGLTVIMGDEAGNTGIAPVLISARPEVKTNDPDDGGSGGVSGGTSSSTGDPGVVLYAAAALLSLGSAVLTGRKKRR